MTPSTSSAVAPRPQPALAEASRVFGTIWSSSLWLALVHLLANLPLGVVYFVLLVTGLSLGIGLLITLLGIPVLIGTGWLVRTLGHVERLRFNTFLGSTLRDPVRPSTEPSGWTAHLAAIGKDPAMWRDFLFLILRLPMGLLTFTIALTTWLLAVGLLLSPVASLFGVFQLTIGRWSSDGPVAVMAATLGGVVMFVLAIGVTKGLAGLEAVLAGALLDASPEELQRRVTEIADSRTRSMSAADQERRRLERDLHDGAQQRLVSLAMTLGLAQQKLQANPEEGARLVAEAHEEAKRALQDLRDLARGLHPAVLTDHGLEAALPALVARCPVPARVAVAVSPRPSPAVESAAYFVVAEALTNVARHAHATGVHVTARRADGVLVVDVQDDGAGHARVVPGGGLAGLTDRVEALGGRLTVSSPGGGPTVVHVEMPCG